MGYHSSYLFSFPTQELKASETPGRVNINGTQKKHIY